MWYADGRGGEYNLGKHSLNTRSREDALEQLQQLDRDKAIELGLTVQPAQAEDGDIGIEQGWQLFLDHCNRPEVMGGVSKSTFKRYRAVRDKHLEWCEQKRLKTWRQITKQQVEKYGHWLGSKEYAERSVYFELMLLKSVVKWLIEGSNLPESCQFKRSLRCPEGTNTYCYSQAEVQETVAHCQANPNLHWLRDVIITLACSGLRIGELAALRYSDVDLPVSWIQLTDERSSHKRQQLGTARRTKGRRGRTLPIHPQLRAVLERLQPHSDGRLLTVRGEVSSNPTQSELF